jgi:hypothetical protein
MTTKHTPRPWTIDHERIGPFGEPVALLCDMTASSPGTVVDWPRETEVADDAENEANARLLASAPELLRALENAYADINWFLTETMAFSIKTHSGVEVVGGVRDTLADIKQAIAMAKGGG